MNKLRQIITTTKVYLQALINVSLTINPLISVRIKAENMKDLKKNTQQKSNDITNGLQRYANSNNNSNNGYAKKYINSNFDSGIRKNMATQANTAKFIRTAIINCFGQFSICNIFYKWRVDGQC